MKLRLPIFRCINEIAFLKSINAMMETIEKSNNYNILKFIIQNPGLCETKYLSSFNIDQSIIRKYSPEII